MEFIQHCILHRVRASLRRVRKKKVYRARSEEEFVRGFEGFKRRWMRVYPDVVRSVSAEKVMYLVIEEMNERYKERRIKNFEEIIENLKALRRGRYGYKEIRINTNLEKIHTQKT